VLVVSPGAKVTSFAGPGWPLRAANGRLGKYKTNSKARVLDSLAVRKHDSLRFSTIVENDEGRLYWENYQAGTLVRFTTPLRAILACDYRV
jgi:hypothetical protein